MIMALNIIRRKTVQLWLSLDLQDQNWLLVSWETLPTLTSIVLAFFTVVLYFTLSGFLYTYPYETLKKPQNL